MTEKEMRETHLDEENMSEYIHKEQCGMTFGIQYKAKRRCVNIGSFPFVLLLLLSLCQQNSSVFTTKEAMAGYNGTFFQLSSGAAMPTIGYGTWRAPDDEIENALNLSLEAGYRHIDCAPVYLNEKAIGRVLKRWIDDGKVKRSELFITTKLPISSMRYGLVEKALKQSLDDLNLSYIDLYLIHVPFAVPESGVAFDNNGDLVLDLSTDHIAIWKGLEEQVDAGLAKSIGLSNFNETQIQRVIDNSRIKPAVLQVELHVYLQQTALVDYCKRNNIFVTAYAPLGSKGISALYPDNREIPDLLEIPEIKEIGERHGKTPAQILLKWILSRGISTIPKSTNEKRLKQNLDLFNFELDDNDMNVIKGLDKNIRICNFDFFKGANKHPQFPF